MYCLCWACIVLAGFYWHSCLVQIIFNSMSSKIIGLLGTLFSCSCSSMSPVPSPSLKFLYVASLCTWIAPRFTRLLYLILKHNYKSKYYSIEEIIFENLSYYNSTAVLESFCHVVFKNSKSM